jgi:hypothetical protein
LNAIFIRLNDFGLMDVIVPFLLIFSVMFAILTQIGLFDPEKTGKNKNIIMFISMAFALMVVVPHVLNTYPPGADIVQIINTSVPNVSVFIISVIMILVIIGLFGIRFTPGGSGMGMVTIVAMLVVAYIFGSSAGWFDFGLPAWLGFLNDPDLQAILLVGLMFWIVIAMVTGTGGGGNRAWTGFQKFFGENFNVPK